VSTTDGSNLISEIDAFIDLIIRIVRMKGAIEQLVNTVTDPDRTCRTSAVYTGQQGNKMPSSAP
jgi:hypothetical protein